MPVLTQRVAGSSSGLSRAMSSCQTQGLRSGASMPNSARNSPNGPGPMSSGVRRAKEQCVAALPLLLTVAATRSDALVDHDPAASSTREQAQSAASALSTTAAADTISSIQQGTKTQLQGQETLASLECSAADVSTAIGAVGATDNHTGLMAAPELTLAVGDIHPELATTTFVPLLGGPPSPTRSSAPCSPASSINLSGPCSTVLHSSSYRLPSSSGGPEPMSMSYTPSGTCKPRTLEMPSLRPSERQHGTHVDQRSHVLPQQLEQRSQKDHDHHQQLQLHGRQQQQQQQQHKQHLQTCQEQEKEDVLGASHALASIPCLTHFVSANSSGASSRRSSLRDQNSVTIKATTVVKDAAGAIDKILSRGVTALVTALRSGNPPYTTPYDSLNQAVKAIAVARQYAKETGPQGSEVTFLPFHRHDNTEHADPSRFAFLVFPVPRLMETLKTADETVLNVARGSDVHKMAGAIIAVMLDRGQAVMKAAGSDAIFVAMSAVVNARHRLVQKHGFDLMLAAAWITEDTVSTMGRESKFLRFNILKTEPAGPKGDVLPALHDALGAC